MIDFAKDFIEKLKRVKLLPNEYASLEFRDQCYEKWKSKIPCDMYFMATLTDTELIELLLAYQLYLYDDVKHRLGNGAKKTELATNDLVSYLKNPVKNGMNGDKLTRAQHGLDFAKDFVRDLIYKTAVMGKYTDPARNLDLPKNYHRAIVLNMIYGSPKPTIAEVSRSLQITGSVQAVSNFRPMSSACLMHRYAIAPNPNKKDIHILVPSEGFLGRLLSSYYIAYHNRDKQIHYHSIDPNEHLREPYERMVRYLKNYGGFTSRLTNWHPHFHCHGSEVDRANLGKHLNIEFDFTFTSPPYFSKELYLSAVDLYLCTDDTHIEAQQSFTETLQPTHGCRLHRLTDTEYHSLNYRVGDHITLDNTRYLIFKINKDTQSHSIGKNKETWNELFFRPTVINMRESLKQDGYMLWNVADVKQHPNLEADVVRICEEEGFILTETLQYELSRRPGPGSKDKRPYEPVFVFRKRP